MKYVLHGLILDTPFPCPELPPSTGDADVAVAWGTTDKPSHVWHEVGVCHKAAPGKYLLSASGVANFLVENGDRVTIEKTGEADEDSLRLFFYHEVMGALLMQRGFLVLKGCVVERNGKGIAFVGPTPSGKTMTAATLAKRNYRVVADGFFCLAGDETLSVQPGYPWLGLWEKSLDDLGISHEGLKPLRKGMRRFYLPLDRSSCNRPVRLERIYVLAFHNRAELSIETLRGAEKLFALLNHRYHPELAAPLGMTEPIHRLAANLAKSATVRIVRHNDTLVPFEQYIERMEEELEENVP